MQPAALARCASGRERPTNRERQARYWRAESRPSAGRSSRDCPSTGPSLDLGPTRPSAQTVTAASAQRSGSTPQTTSCVSWRRLCMLSCRRRPGRHADVCVRLPAVPLDDEGTHSVQCPLCSVTLTWEAGPRGGGCQLSRHIGAGPYRLLMEALGRPTVGLSGRSLCLALEPDVSQPALSASSFAERRACPGLHVPGPAGEATSAADRIPFELASRSTYVRTELQGTQDVIRHDVCAGVRCYYRTLGSKTCGSCASLRSLSWVCRAFDPQERPPKAD
jgi:hypothetical protein